MSLSVSSTIWIFSTMHESAASTTWNIRSDSMESSRVDPNAAIRSGGRSRINPIVSFRSIFFHNTFSKDALSQILESIHTFHTEVPRVAKSLSSASTHFFVSVLKSDDFPALVYPTIPTVGNFFLLRFSR